MKNYLTLLCMLLCVFASVATVNAAAAEPKVTWESKAYGIHAMKAGETCWGDMVGPFAGPVVVKATAAIAAMPMVNAACALEPSVTLTARLDWAKAKYAAGRVWWGTTAKSAVFPTPTPTPVATKVVATGKPTTLWATGVHRARTKAVTASTACWGTLVRVGTTNHYNKVVVLTKATNVVVADGFCAPNSSALAAWVRESTGISYAVVNGN